MSDRRLTVSRLVTPRARPSAGYEAAPSVPFVRLSGRWLSQLGFAPGDRVQVAAEPGRLVITRSLPEGS